MIYLQTKEDINKYFSEMDADSLETLYLLLEAQEPLKLNKETGELILGTTGQGIFTDYNFKKD